MVTPFGWTQRRCAGTVVRYGYHVVRGKNPKLIHSCLVVFLQFSLCVGSLFFLYSFCERRQRFCRNCVCTAVRPEAALLLILTLFRAAACRVRSGPPWQWQAWSAPRLCFSCGPHKTFDSLSPLTWILPIYFNSDCLLVKNMLFFF